MPRNVPHSTSLENPRLLLVTSDFKDSIAAVAAEHKHPALFLSDLGDVSLEQSVAFALALRGEGRHRRSSHNCSLLGIC